MATFYVDHSAANDGDGSDAAQAAGAGLAGAFNSLVGHLGSISAADVVWMRRTASVETLSADLQLWDGGELNGWPMSTDENYAGRPAAGTSAGWDADAALYAQFTTSSYLNNMQRDTNDVAVMSLRRLKLVLTSTSTSSSAYALVLESGSKNTRFRYCRFERGDGVANIPGGGLVEVEDASHNTFEDCEFIRTAPDNTGSNWLGLVRINTSSSTGRASYNKIINCSFDVGNVDKSDNSPDSGVILSIFAYGSISYAGAVACNSVVGCTFVGTAQADEDAVGADNEPWIYIGPSTHTRFTDCTIQDNNTSIEFCKQSLLISSAKNARVERIKLIRGGTVYIEDGSRNNYIDIFNSDFITGTVAKTTSSLDLNGDGTRAIIRASTFARSLAANIWGGDINGHTTAVGCKFVGPSTYVASSNNSITQVGSGTMLGVWEEAVRPGVGFGLTANSGIVRTGGASYSLSLKPIPRRIVRIKPVSIGSGDLPTIFLTGTSGANTITLYGCYKLLPSVPTGYSVFFEVYYLDASNNLKTISSRGASLVSDGSTWTGASGLTVFKQELNLTLASNQSLPVVVYFKPDSVENSQMFIDPVMTVA